MGISVKQARGYLKNLHLAQILYYADIKEHEICSPAETKTSYSSDIKLLEISFDFFMSSFVAPLIAEEVTITL